MLEVARQAIDFLLERGLLQEAAAAGQQADDAALVLYLRGDSEHEERILEGLVRYSGLSGQVLHYLHRHGHDQRRVQRLVSVVLGSPEVDSDLLAELAEGFEQFAFERFTEGEMEQARELFILNVALRERVLEVAPDEAKPHLHLAGALSLLDLLGGTVDPVDPSGRRDRIAWLRGRYQDLGGEPLQRLNIDDEVDFSDVLIDPTLGPDSGGAAGCLHESVGARKDELEQSGRRGDGHSDPMRFSRRLVRLANHELELGRQDRAVETLEECVALRRRILQQHGETLEAMRELAVALRELGLAEEARDREGRALVAHAESLALFERLLERTGPTQRALEDHGSGLYMVGLCLVEHRERERACQRFLQCIENGKRRLELFGASPEVMRWIIDVLEWVWALERALGNPGRAKKALAERREVQQLLSAVSGTGPGLGAWCQSVVRLMGKLFWVESAGLRAG